MMIDPIKITNFNLNDAELEEHILFWVCAAGKNGVTAAKCLDNFNKLSRKYIIDDIRLDTYLWRKPKFYNLYDIKNASMFDLIKSIKHSELPRFMASAGIGCFNQKARTFLELAESNLNLKTCSVDDLEKIKGIGPKTSRCFIMHSRPNQRLAGLDVHILRFLKDKGYNVPKATPTGKKYKIIEQWFLKEADAADMDTADFDLMIWNKYRK
jgi:hypothetical protein